MRHYGFTLIELILTMVILAILAVFATPKLFSLGTDARIATVKDMKGIIETSSKNANLKCHISPECDATAWGPKQILDGMEFCLLEGWFDAGTGGPLGTQPVGSCGIDMYIKYNATDWEVVAHTGYEHHFRLRSAPDPTNCFAAYRQPASRGVLPEYKMTTTGC